MVNQIDERNIAVLSYLTPIGWIIAYILYQQNAVKSEFSAFHLRQSLGVFILGIAMMFIGVIFSILPLIGILTYPVVKIAFVVMWGTGIYYAIDRRLEPIPLVGELFQIWFSNIY